MEIIIAIEHEIRDDGIPTPLLFVDIDEIAATISCSRTKPAGAIMAIPRSRRLK
ncbi:MAG: hypothetical protein PUG00_00980 [Clostridiales bacterium]|nr:hypothetical protein [Clostridiales bacterium]